LGNITKNRTRAN